MSLSKQEFTNAGRSMLGRAQNGEILTITKIVVGSGGATQPSDLWPLTALVVPEIEVTISARDDDGAGTLLVEGSFKSTDAPHPFDLRELGVMAHIGTETDRLYSVANVFDDPPDHIDPAAPTIQAFKIKLVIDRIPTDHIVIQIGPTENVIGENVGLDTVGPGFYKEAAGNVLRFKRAKEGFGMLITDEGDDVKFDVIGNTLQNDLDIGVPMSYPSPPPGWILKPDIQAAVDYLKTFMIPTDKFARIHVADNLQTPNWGTTGDGKYQNPQGISFSHPNSSQIALLGAPFETYNITQIVYVDSTHKKVTLATGTDMTKFWVGALVTIDFSHASWSGGSRITAINAGARQLTLSIINRSARAPFSTAENGSAAKLRLYKTIIKCTSTIFGVGNIQFPYGIQRVENIACEGGYGCFGAGGYDAVFKNCLAMGITDSTAGHNPTVKGFSNPGSAGLGLFGQCCAADIANFGIIGFIFAPEVTLVNGCGAGIVPAAASTVGAVNADMAAFGYPDSRAYVTHNGHGFRIWGAGLNCGSVAYTNNDVGFHLNIMGYLSNGPWGSAGLNNTWDLFVMGMSYAFYECGSFGFPAHVSPPLVQTVPPQPSGWGERREGGPANFNSYIVVQRDGDPTP